ncbi:MAG: hypothetical protein MKZ89_12850 [Nisaea sp.]|nr:hypothetical protein [Nisaea sp.]
MAYTANNHSAFSTSLQILEKTLETIRSEPGTGATLFYDPIKDIAGSVDGSDYNHADKNWAEAALVIYDLYRDLGGEALRKTIYFSQKEKSFLITISGQNNVWHESGDKALTFFLFNLLDLSNVLSKHDLSDKLRKPERAFAPIEKQLEQLIQSLNPPPKLNTDEILEVHLPESEIAIVDRGLNIQEYQIAGNGVSAKVMASDDAKPGLHSVFGFSSKMKFRPTSIALVNVLGSSNEKMSQIKNSKDVPKEVPLRSGEKHFIGNNSEEKRFEFTVTSPSAVHFESVGPTDVVGTITNKTGKILLTNDDGGANYNFALRKHLPPGDYILSVKHCCFGRGPFSLIVNKDPLHKN